MLCNSCCQALLTRREALKTSALGFGYLALAALAQEHAAAQAPRPLAPRPPQFRARARRVIFVFQHGGPSQLDTFDYKPELNRRHGQPLPGGREDPKKLGLFGSPFAFRQHGRSGLWISELWSQLARHADDLCLINSLRHDTPGHENSQIFMHTGESRFVRPSFGAWTTYGLGSESTDLPGFVVINPDERTMRSYASAFLPSVYAATPFRNISTGRPSVADLSNARTPLDWQRKQVDLIQSLNRTYQQSAPDDHRIDAVIESYERGFAMQRAVPELLDLAGETRQTLRLYGLDGSQPRNQHHLSMQCLLARRFAERGVRFIEINVANWDHHANLAESLRDMCQGADGPLAALVTDLKQRGMFQDTLLVLGGEFGRTPGAQADNPNQRFGRDHNPQGFTYVLAGGGVKGGSTYGATDALGFQVVDRPVSPFDLFATMLHLLGMDHERLTYRHAGRDFRLTDVHGRVIGDIVA